MKEITRIHIAKISYDIEIAAKNDLETYIKTLEVYNNDAEILEDVEVRITEILSERGIVKGGVIAQEDVTALKRQLGEPKDFIGDGDISLGTDDTTEVSTRRLYRDTDNAVLGGVMSGIGAFFKVNPLWVRITFIILAFASFGMAVFVYVVLWVAIPPARTAADRLQMTGRPVTVQAIREVIESDTRRAIASSNGTTRRTMMTIVGVLSAIGAVGAAAFTAFVVVSVTFRPDQFMSDGPGSGYVTGAFICAVISGTLLMTLFILVAYAAFTQKMPRRILISLCTVTVLGLMTFGAAIGLLQYGSIEQRQELQANVREIAVPLPQGSEYISNLVTSKTPGLTVIYAATTDTPHATLRAVARSEARMPKIDFSIESTTLKLEKVHITDQLCIDSWWCGSVNQELTIYGPELQTVTAGRDAAIEYRATRQSKLVVNADRQAQVTLSTGEIDDLAFKGNDDARLSASDATVRRASVDMRISTVAELGAVQELSVTDLGSCPARTREALVNVWDITSGSIIINTVPTEAKSTDNGCTEIAIEKEDK